MAAIETGRLAPRRPESRLIASEMLRLRAAIALWRDLHLHLSRNNLGGSTPDPTRSLIGSVNAVATVRQMKADASRRDPLREWAAALGLETQGEPPPLTAYAGSENSLDTYLQECTGRITQRRFPAVQERSGYFGRPSDPIGSPTEKPSGNEI